MDKLYEALVEEKARLERTMQYVKGRRKNKVPGKLRISNAGKRPSYYWQGSGKPEKSANGIFLRKADIKIAKNLADQDYLDKLEKCTAARLKQVDKMLVKIRVCELENIYENMNDARKVLIKPMFMSDDNYAANWQAEAFVQSTREFDPNNDYYSSKGVHVRSKSEKMIADSLERHGIPYRYECRFVGPDGDEFYPDFTCLNKRTRKVVIWEHFGTMHDPGYVETTMWKYSQFTRSGLVPGRDLIMTFESSKLTLSSLLVDAIIEALLM